MRTNVRSGGGVLLNRKGIVPIFVMTLTIFIMLISIGYAALNQNLNISGEAFLRAKDNIRITRIELSDAKDEGYETYSPEYSKKTIKVYSTLSKKTSSVTYISRITNTTGARYKVDSIEVNNTNPNVSCTSSIGVNSVLEKGITEFTITESYKNEMSADTNLDVCSIKYEFSLLDATPPTLMVQLVKDNGNTKTIKIIAEDDAEGSGLSQENVYKYYLSTSNTTLTGGEWKDYINNTEFEISGDFEIKYLWIYPVKDKAGNINDNKENINTAYLLETYTFIDNTPTLYNVLAKEALSGSGLAKLYTGKHNDTYNEIGTRKIYYFNGADSTAATSVLNKNNVLFAGFCWQMIRTTDTGGVKLIYNGTPKEEVETTPISKTEYNVTSNDESYPYTYDSSTNTWTSTMHTNSSSGTIIFKINKEGTYYLNYTVSSEKKYDKATFYKNGTQIGQYSGSVTGNIYLNNLSTSDEIKVVYSKDGSSSSGSDNVIFSVVTPSGEVIQTCNNSGTEQQIGKSEFNSSSGSPAYVGYMYNTVYMYKSKSMVTTEDVFSGYYSLSTNYWYADSITYDSSTGKYNLVNPYQVSSTSDYASLRGKYTFSSSTETYTNSTVYYIGVISGNYYYRTALSNGNLIDYYDDGYTYGTSYTKNQDGTYTINEPTTITRTTYYDNYNNLKGKYVCKNAVNNSCSMLCYVSSTGSSSFSWISSANEYKYAKGFTYSTSENKYTLNDESVMIWNLGDSSEVAKLNNAHYTCFNEAGECSTIYYIYYVNGTTPYYIELNNGTSIEEALKEMLSADNVNQTNSTIKNTIDTWYKNNMTSYTEYLEDTVFCNDRNISSYNGWNPDGGSVTNDLLFKNSNTVSDLYCANETDRFSVGNSKAKLTYPVGLMTTPEMKLLGYNSIRATRQLYWLASPYGFINVYASVRDVYSLGDIYYYYKVSDPVGARPSVSLAPNTQYSSGAGSVTDPYIVKTS